MYTYTYRYLYVYIYIELYTAQCTIYACTIIYGLHARLGQRSGNDGCCSTLIPELASAGVSMEGFPDAVPNSSSPSFSEHKQSVKETELHKTDAISFEKIRVSPSFQMTALCQNMTM